MLPGVRISWSIKDVYLYNNEEDVPSNREILSRNDLERYVEREVRRRNSRILRHLYTSKAKLTVKEGIG